MELLSTLLILLFITYYIQLGVYIICELKNPTKALGWLILLFLLPIIGLLFYFIIRKRWKLSPQLIKSEYSTRALDLEALLFFEGEPLFDHMFAQMHAAKHHIHIAFFIIRDDHIGKRMQEILVDKAKGGCHVRLIYDGIGSINLSKKYVQALKQAGVEVHSFLPLHFPWLMPRLNTRYHRKIVVIDDEIAYIGGFNFGKEYVGENPKLGHWRDAHVMIRGGSVDTLQHIFITDWYQVSKQKLSMQSNDSKRIAAPIEKTLFTDIVWSGPNSPYPYSLHQIIAFLYQVKRKVLIATPYLVPDPSLLMVLKERSAAGIEIIIMLPNKADHRLVYYATQSYIEELMLAGVKIYLYQSGFMHSKMMISDDTSVFIGTANLDMRSFFLNYEVNAVIYDKDTVRVAQEQFERDLQNSAAVTLESFQNRAVYKKIAEAIARLFSPLL